MVRRRIEERKRREKQMRRKEMEEMAIEKGENSEEESRTSRSRGNARITVRKPVNDAVNKAPLTLNN